MVRRAATTLGIDQHDLPISPLAHDSSFSSVELCGEYLRGSVRLITSVFAQGGITVLIGTKSLLGEGWDAPCINTLVLASFVGSFMLSNQMRGRGYPGGFSPTAEDREHLASCLCRAGNLRAGRRLRTAGSPMLGVCGALSLRWSGSRQS
jgi:hypothetical protein